MTAQQVHSLWCVVLGCQTKRTSLPHCVRGHAHSRPYSRPALSSYRYATTGWNSKLRTRKTYLLPAAIGIQLLTRRLMRERTPKSPAHCYLSGERQLGLMASTAASECAAVSTTTKH